MSRYKRYPNCPWRPFRTADVVEDARAVERMTQAERIVRASTREVAVRCGRCSTLLGHAYLIEGEGETSASYVGEDASATLLLGEAKPRTLCERCAKALVSWLDAGKLS